MLGGANQIDQNATVKIQNATLKPKKKGYFGKIGPRFGHEKPAIPGPGRPKLPPDYVAMREETKRILLENSARAAQRLAELMESKEKDIAIRASDGILKRTVPELGEMKHTDDRPLEALPDGQLEILLARIRSGGTRHPEGDELQT